MQLKIIALLLLIASQAYATESSKDKITYSPSFNCEGVTKQQHIEHIICSDKELSEQDRLLSILYNASQEKHEKPQQLINDQRAWLKSVRNKCTTKSCLKSVYSSRELYLGELLVTHREFTLTYTQGGRPFWKKGNTREFIKKMNSIFNSPNKELLHCDTIWKNHTGTINTGYAAICTALSLIHI